MHLSGKLYFVLQHEFLYATKACDGEGSPGKKREASRFSGLFMEVKMYTESRGIGFLEEGGVIRGHWGS